MRCVCVVGYQRKKESERKGRSASEFCMCCVCVWVSLVFIRVLRVCRQNIYAMRSGFVSVMVIVERVGDLSCTVSESAAGAGQDENRSASLICSLLELSHIIYLFYLRTTCLASEREGQRTERWEWRKKKRKRVVDYYIAERMRDAKI